MKKYLFMFLMAIAPMAFVACGSDDDDNNDPNTENPDVEVSKATFEETSNQLKLTYTLTAQTNGKSVSVKDEWTCDYDGQDLVKSSHKMTFPNAEAAQASYEEWMEEYGSMEGYSASCKGSVMTYEDTPEWTDYPKDAMKTIMQAMAAQYK